MLQLIQMNEWLLPAVEDGLSTGAAIIIAVAQELASQRLQTIERYNRSFSHRVVGRLNVAIVNDHPFADAIENGTRQHFIGIRNPRLRALRYAKDSELRFRAWTVHPGARPFRIITDAASGMANWVAICVSSAVDNLLRRFGR